MKKTALTLLSLALCLALCACAAVPQTPPAADPVKTQPPVGTPASSGTPAAAQPYELRTAADYGDVLALFTARQQKAEAAATGRDWSNGVFFDGEMSVATDAVMPEATADAPAEASAAADKGAADFDGTNVQVAGIDEGDIVKTDGEYLYVLSSDGQVRILAADGADTRQVGAIALEGEDWWGSELYINGDTLAVIRSVYDHDKEGKDGAQTVAQLYDVSDPAAPKRTASLGQDGNYAASRLMDGKLYLLSNLYVWYWLENGERPDERIYVPCLYEDGAERLMPAGCILLPGETEDQSYTVLTCLDLASGQRISEQAVLGNSGTVYMSGENLYLCATRYEQTESEPRTERQYTVVDWKSGSSTTITRFALEDGALTLAATGSVPGNLLNQFSLDEQDGFLRVVTTIDQYSYSIYTDEAFGFTNYKDGDSLRCNALYVLDSGLNTVGSVEDLAEDERVYSVRFDGDIGYFVTYRQVDPLFAVDLSDPAAPTVLSALKIPGFSQYLHVYGEGLLFGFGQSTTGEDGTITDGLKLSMFDVSDPADVTEQSTLKLDGHWSEAQYNHKAILVLPERDLIAFPMDGSYVVYGYGADGFYERARMEAGELWLDEARGVRIGELLYVCARNGVGVYDLSGFTVLAKIGF